MTRRSAAAISLCFEPLEVRDVPAAYNLQLLHASDLEPGLGAIDDAPRFAAVVQYLDEDRFAGGDPRKAAFDGSILLSSGDNNIAGAFYAASGDAALNGVLGAASQGRAGIEIMNRIGFDASALGNHEFDQGTRELATIINNAGAWQGALFPYLSANLNFAPNADLSALVVAGGTSTTGIAAGRIAPSVRIDADGAGPGTEFIGVIGITTPLLASISSPGNVGISPAGATNPLTPGQLQELAAIVQAQVTTLQGQGVNKIILVSHLQQLSEEQALVPLLTGVDVVIAGGSDTRLADANDVLRPGDVAEGTYPILLSGADANPVLLVSTDGNFSYVGRLVLPFDSAGVLVTAELNTVVNGAYSTDLAGVERLYGVGADFLALSTRATAVKQVTDAVDAVITAKDGTVFGRTDVYLNGLRAEVRTEETNLGNLTADANLQAARDFDTATGLPLVSVKNGGGIRDSIGTVDSGTGVRATTAANPEANKLAGQVSDLDIENSLRFNNTLSAVTITAANLKQVLEHAVAAVAPGATPGQFAQIGGIRYSYDATRTAQTVTGAAGTGLATITPGNRVVNAVITDEAGNVLQELVRDGVLVGDPNRLIRVVTLSFLINDGDNDGRSGDNYPFATFRTQLTPAVFNRVDLQEGGANLGEQRALERFLQARFPAAGPVGFAQADVPAFLDGRIQNLAVRTDTVLTGAATPVVSPGAATVNGRTPVTVTVQRNAVNGNEVAAFRITGVVGGTVFAGGVAVPDGEFVEAADALAGLTFVAADGFLGAAGFAVQASLSASVAGLGGDIVPVVVTVRPSIVAPPVVQFLDPTTGRPAADFQPFPGFSGPFQTATGDVTGDQIADVVVGAGNGGGPVIKLFDGVTGAELRSFAAFEESFRGGVQVAVGDVTGDDVADFVAGAGNGGGPVVKVFDGRTGELVQSFFAFEDSFRGGVNVAVGDVNGDGVADIIVGAGVGGGPVVKVFDGRTGELLESFFAYDANFRGGVVVAVGDLDGDGLAEIVTTVGGDGGPHVKTFDPADGTERLSFFAFDSILRIGLGINLTDIDGDGDRDIVVLPPVSSGLSPRAFDGRTGDILDDVLLGADVG